MPDQSKARPFPSSPAKRLKTTCLSSKYCANRVEDPHGKPYTWTHACWQAEELARENTFDDFNTSGIYKSARKPGGKDKDVQTAEKHSSRCYSRSQINKRAAELWRRPNLNQPGLWGEDRAAETEFTSWHPMGALMCIAVT